MATTKAKKPAAKRAPAKKAPAKRPAARRTPAKKASASVARRMLITRNDEYTQLTWILVSIWLVLIAIFLGVVIGKVG